MLAEIKIYRNNGTLLYQTTLGPIEFGQNLDLRFPEGGVIENGMVVSQIILTPIVKEYKGLQT